ncbi:DUF1524 domain-containing protein [Cellulomonas sp.]|uniref:GmrSD restriction endonuclease domain-containing protein n=1 Tax=Cellulomonas sp. TaxID=40001 RepID=UPI00258BEB2D|nr:DUF1524 domain-containing protein [Cellulomonas sp.]MCR6689472.1 excalibur calcium-binding domain-containing protein [Cellulomonas sp.]
MSRTVAARRRPPRAIAAACLVAVALLLPAGCAVAAGAGPDRAVTPSATSVRPAPASPLPAGPTPASPAPAPERSGTPHATAAPLPGSALATLAQLDVKGRAPLTDYDRARFGYEDGDLDGDGCDTRNEILRRDLVDVVLRPDGCLVDSGVLADPYSGRTIAFERGVQTSPLVQIDHVVALADAWQKGAQHWDAATSERFGNDPLNLLAVDGPLNQRKGAGDAATWLPPHKAFRCAYVARQVAVKHAYGLWVTAAERDAMARVLGGCPDEPLPGPSGPAPRSPASPGPAVPSTPTPGSPAPTPPADAPYYASCAEARAAGVTPLHRGTPGYRPGMDGDGDGIACE